MRTTLWIVLFPIKMIGACVGEFIRADKQLREFNKLFKGNKNEAI